MARMTNIEKVRKAIEIQGHIIVSVGGRDAQVRSIEDVDGEWVTDVLTSDLCGYVRIRKTKAVVVARAEYVIAHEVEIRANRARSVCAFLDR